MIHTTQTHEQLANMKSVEARVGGQEALHAGLVALQGAVDSGEAVKMGTNVVGAEVDVSEQSLEDDGGNLITGSSSKVNGELYGSFVHNSTVDGTSRVMTSDVIDSELAGVRIEESLIHDTAMSHNGTVDNSTVRKSNIQLARDPLNSKGLKSGKLNVFESSVVNYDHSASQADGRIALVRADVKSTDDVKSVRGVALYPNTAGQTIYKMTNSQYGEPLTTPQDVVDATPGLKRRDRKEFLAQLEAASK